MIQALPMERESNAACGQTVVIPRRSEKQISDHCCKDVSVEASNRLRSCPYYELRQLWCEFRDGILMIRGQVSSYYLKQRAQETIRSIAGNTRIENHLVVVYVRQMTKSDETMER